MPKSLMKNLKVFERFKNDKKTVIITDVDGTISEIVPTPQEAFVSYSMKETLTGLSKKFQMVAVVSGRPVEDVKRMIGIEGLLYVGNHGMEYMKNGQIQVEEDTKRYIQRINEAACKIKEEESCNAEGVLLEDKGLCFSIHYRLCKDPNARKILLDALKDMEELKGLQIKEGRKVIEIRPPTGYDKGKILERIVKDHDVKSVIYLGDDVTDSDAFRKLNELKTQGKLDGESIIILSGEIPSRIKEEASYFLESVDDVLKFFEWLLD
ncbi:putative trehalose-phosphate phosphatase 8 [Methanobacterium congolense]|uniref:Trehalose 6-phosphate phosphatase n=2 Tax=Methanobacterium congolense TaxID=118062 RepID=A0A1D3L2Z5_9EURY|nr:putative trehalose-phosphate phosphatase 8 [Methanobacterium congolense]